MKHTFISFPYNSIIIFWDWYMDYFAELPAFSLQILFITKTDAGMF